MAVVVSVENLLMALFCAGVIGFAAFAPLIIAIKGALKRLDEGQDEDTYIFLRFCGIFFIFQAAALSVAMFLTFMINIILQHDPAGGLENAFKLFWSITPEQVAAIELQSLAFFIVAVRGFFIGVCSILPFAMLILAISFIYKGIAAKAKNQDAYAPGTDTIMLMFKGMVVSVLLFIVFIGWSMMVAAVVNHPQGLTPYQIGQNFWREAAGLSTSTPTNTPAGMSAGEALRKGMYIP